MLFCADEPQRGAFVVKLLQVDIHSFQGRSQSRQCFAILTMSLVGMLNHFFVIKEKKINYGIQIKTPVCM